MYVLIFLFGLCWGSFLNVVGYRLVCSKRFFTLRSFCPNCNAIISWYDNIPVISWLLLRAKCRSCKEPISFLYPFFEIVTAVLSASLYQKFIPRIYPWYYYFSIDSVSLESDVLFTSVSNKVLYHEYLSLSVFFMFFSLLIVASRSDLQAMVIPQICTVWFIPVGFISSYFNLTGISFLNSCLGAFLGYSILGIVSFAFKFFTGRDGMGLGDMELLAMIGSFLGPIGVWFSLMIGSFLGLLIGSFYLSIFKKNRLTRIPFGPFLSLGAVIYFFFQYQLINFFWIN